MLEEESLESKPLLSTASQPCTGRRASLNSHQRTSNAVSDRIMELELEIQRLQELVAELLIKNQQLRRCPD
jgi:hypothetical protein